MCTRTTLERLLGWQTSDISTERQRIKTTRVSLTEHRDTRINKRTRVRRTTRDSGPYLSNISTIVIFHNVKMLTKFRTQRDRMDRIQMNSHVYTYSVPDIGFEKSLKRRGVNTREGIRGWEKRKRKTTRRVTVPSK